jgi:hypothetical protein
MKILLIDFNNILVDVGEKLRSLGHTVLVSDGKDTTVNQAEVIVLWQETELGGWKEWVVKQQKKGKRVVLVQHGRRGTSRIYPPFNEKLVSDVVCVWGENDRQRLLECGVPPEKIRVTGTPVLRHALPRLPHTGINVVFSPEHWDVDVVENLIVASALRRVDGIIVTSKLLAEEHNPREYDNPIISDRRKAGHLDTVVKTLQTADAVVAISESTFELFAEIMDIPVIIADIWIPKSCAGDDRYKEYKREYSNACEMVKNMDKLDEAIWRHVRNPQLLQKERKEIGILDGGMDIADPVNEIIKVICES